MGEFREKFRECGPGKPDRETTRPGTWRYCVTCDALVNGKPAQLQHPWREVNKEVAIAKVIADPRNKRFDKIKNCQAYKIPGSYKKP
jgi:hypothetical protein